MTDEPAVRLAPLLPPQWDDHVLDALGAFPKGLDFVLNSWKENGAADRGTHVLGTMAHYPALAKAFLTFNNHVSANSSLSAREREILILRTGWLRKAEYEYYQHVVLALRAGLTEAEIELIRVGSGAPGLQPEDAELVRAAEELVADAELSDATWQRLSARYSKEQLMDLIFVVGCYEIIALVSKSLRTPQEPGTGRLDPAVRERLYAQ